MQSLIRLPFMNLTGRTNATSQHACPFLAPSLWHRTPGHCPGQGRFKSPGSRTTCVLTCRYLNQPVGRAAGNGPGEFPGGRATRCTAWDAKRSVDQRLPCWRNFEPRNRRVAGLWRKWLHTSLDGAIWPLFAASDERPSVLGDEIDSSELAAPSPLTTRPRRPKK